jgi:hypothetical protein
LLVKITNEIEAKLVDIYKYKDYRQLIKDRIQFEGRGAHGRIAEAARCQSSYLSQVLSGSSQLTTEQAYAIAASWGLDDDGVEYVTGLVQLDRSATKEYRLHWQKKLASIASRKEQLSERVDVPVLTKSAAVNVLATIGSLNVIV